MAYRQSMIGLRQTKVAEGTGIVPNGNLIRAGAEPVRAGASALALSTDEAQGVLEVASQIYCAPNAERMPGEFLLALRPLIPFELGGCHVTDRERRILSACYQPERPFVPAQHKEFHRLVQAHPLNPLLQANPARAFILSDAISLEAFLQTELYELLYRPLHLNRELTAMLPDSSAEGGFLLISLHRWGREFSERDRALLNLLLPHVAQARRRLTTAAQYSSGGLALDNEDKFCEWIRSATNWRLTRRESDVLFWLSQGKTNAEIGRILGMAERTAETHALRLYPKIGVENRYNAIAMLSRLACARG
jgi:DNA-binding CsgD family transcriptional regulator